MGFAFFNRNISRCLFAALLASLVLDAYPAGTRNCTPDEKAEADKKLWLNKRDSAAAINRHLPWRTRSLNSCCVGTPAWPARLVVSLGSLTTS